MSMNSRAVRRCAVRPGAEDPCLLDVRIARRRQGFDAAIGVGRLFSVDLVAPSCVIDRGSFSLRPAVLRQRTSVHRDSPLGLRSLSGRWAARPRFSLGPKLGCSVADSSRWTFWAAPLPDLRRARSRVKVT
jgi:hypothetical protein